MLYSFYFLICPGGEIGRHARLRIWYREVCRFESYPGQHLINNFTKSIYNSKCIIHAKRVEGCPITTENKTVQFFGYVGGVLLSCGPSQAYGLIKGAIDTARLATIQAKIFYYGRVHRECQLKAPSSSSLDAVQKGLDNVAQIHFQRNQELRVAKIRALKADALALIPFVGAICSWKVYQKDQSLNPFESATEQVLEDYNNIVAKLLFYPGALPGVLPSNPHKTVLDPYKISIPVFDPHVPGATRDIRAYHMKHDANSRPTVVIFHANAMTSEDMCQIGVYYFTLGYDVLMPTMGGYPGSRGISPTEESSYRDVEAVKQYLQTQSVTEVGYHGLSIGASLAFQAAVGATAATGLKTKFVVADQAFSTAERVAEHVVTNGPGGAMRPFARGAVRACFPHHKVDLGEGVVTQCDGLDNERKAKKMREQNIALFVIEASHDDIMARRVIDEHGKHYYEDNCGDTLMTARYEEMKMDTCVTLAMSGHGKFFTSSEVAAMKLGNFTCENMPLRNL